MHLCGDSIATARANPNTGNMHYHQRKLTQEVHVNTYNTTSHNFRSSYPVSADWEAPSNLWMLYTTIDRDNFTRTTTPRQSVYHDLGDFYLKQLNLPSIYALVLHCVFISTPVTAREEGCQLRLYVGHQGALVLSTCISSLSTDAQPTLLVNSAVSYPEKNNRLSIKEYTFLLA